MTVNHRSLIEQLIAGLNTRDFASLEKVYTPDVVIEYPQSGETIRGWPNLRAVFEHYSSADGRLNADQATLSTFPSDAEKIVAPLYTIIRVQGAGDIGTCSVRSVYPDGSTWWVILLYRLRQDRIAWSQSFFAPEFEAPDWRKPYAERPTKSIAR